MVILLCEAEDRIEATARGALFKILFSGMDNLREMRLNN